MLLYLETSNEVMLKLKNAEFNPIVNKMLNINLLYPIHSPSKVGDLHSYIPSQEHQEKGIMEVVIIILVRRKTTYIRSLNLLRISTLMIISDLMRLTKMLNTIN
jgi:hypothetical protein